MDEGDADDDAVSVDSQDQANLEKALEDGEEDAAQDRSWPRKYFFVFPNVAGWA